MNFKCTLFIALVSTFISFSIVSANHTEGASGTLEEKKPSSIVQLFSKGKKARADLWPIPHGVLTGLPKNMISEHRPCTQTSYRNSCTIKVLKEESFFNSSTVST